MRFRLFKKVIEITGADLFKFIAFTLFALTSSYFSLNMFLELGQKANEKIAMVLLAIGIEALKVYTVILLSNFLMSFKYYFRLRKQSRLHSIIAFDKARALFIYLIIYVISASTSIGASLGFGLTTIDRYNEIHKVTIINTSMEVKSLEEDIISLNEEIKINDDLIKDTKISIEETRRSIEDLDKEVGGYLWYKGEYQKKIDAYNSQIIKYRDKISEIRGAIANKNAEIRASEKLEGTEVRNENLSDTRSMFELIAVALKVSPTAVMFLMMFIIAIVIEIGILTTSPHSKDVNEGKDLEKLLTVLDPKKLKRKIDKQKQKENVESISEIEKPVKEVIREEVNNFILASSGEVPQSIVKVEPAPEPIPEPINVGIEPGPIFKQEEVVAQKKDNVKENSPIEKQNNRNGLLAPMPIKNNPMMREMLQKKGLIPLEDKEKSPLDEVDGRGYPKSRKGFDIKKLND
jgi:hypothetical protein